MGALLLLWRGKGSRGDRSLCHTRKQGWEGKSPAPVGGLGGPCRTRTYDPLIKSQLLYQLS